MPRRFLLALLATSLFLISPPLLVKSVQARKTETSIQRTEDRGERGEGREGEGEERPNYDPPPVRDRIWAPLLLTYVIPQNLAPLIDPTPDYGAWFQNETGHIPNPRYFGAYAFAPLGDTLYFGFGAARPAEDGNDGSLFARTNTSTLEAISSLNEQGFIDITLHQGTLYIPGPDSIDIAPPPAHQWDWGNVYLFTPPDDLVKHRNLPNVIHTWGLWHDDSSHLYAAVSSHAGDYETWSGEVFLSSDDGENWTKLADREQGLGNYRTYDIIGFANRLYATWNDDYGRACGLAVSEDNGSTWNRISALDLATTCRTRLFIHQGKLLILAHNHNGLFSLDTAGNLRFHPFSGFTVQRWAYNYLAHDAQNHLYTLTNDGRVVRTTDLTTWETLLSTDRTFITTTYWPNHDWLILADRGAAYANLWKVDLASATPVTLPSPPHLTIHKTGDSLVLKWSDVTDAYRLYHSATPYFRSHLSNLITGTSQSTHTLPDNNENQYFLVRAEATTGDLSLESNTVGVFHYPLTSGASSSTTHARAPHSTH